MLRVVRMSQCPSAASASAERQWRFPLRPARNDSCGEGSACPVCRLPQPWQPSGTPTTPTDKRPASDRVSPGLQKGVSFTVVAAPGITSLSPISGAVGAAVTITGTNFGSTQGTGTVKFNGTSATVTSWGATSVQTTVPTGATTGNVV